MHGLGSLTWTIVMKFGMRGEIADVIIYAKFNIYWFRGLGVLTPPSLHYSIALAGLSYNSVSLSTAVLHCDTA